MAGRSTLFVPSETTITASAKYDCDTDSVTTDSTIFSDKEYEVEEILFEEFDRVDQETKWLIKWKGYPLSMATWEPRKHLRCDDVLKEWETQKSLIATGRTRPFDVQEFLDACLAHERASTQKRLRRVRKRTKRAEARRHVLYRAERRRSHAYPLGNGRDGTNARRSGIESFDDSSDDTAPPAKRACPSLPSAQSVSMSTGSSASKTRRMMTTSGQTACNRPQINASSDNSNAVALEKHRSATSTSIKPISDQHRNTGSESSRAEPSGSQAVAGEPGQPILINSDEDSDGEGSDFDSGSGTAMDISDSSSPNPATDSTSGRSLKADSVIQPVGNLMLSHLQGSRQNSDKQSRHIENDILYNLSIDPEIEALFVDESKGSHSPTLSHAPIDGTTQDEMDIPSALQQRSLQRPSQSIPASQALQDASSLDAIRKQSHSVSSTTLPDPISSQITKKSTSTSDFKSKVASSKIDASVHGESSLRALSRKTSTTSTASTATNAAPLPSNSDLLTSRPVAVRPLSQKKTSDNVFITRPKTSSETKVDRAADSENNNAKKPTIPQQSLYATLQWRNRAMKRAAREAPPDINALSLIDLKTGRVEGPPAMGETIEHVEEAEIRNEVLQGSNAGQTTQASPLSRSSDHRVGGQDTEQALRRQNSTSTAKPAALASVITAPTAPLSMLNSGDYDRTTTWVTPFGTKYRKSKTCRYWEHGNCKRTAEDCPFAHYYIPLEDLPKDATYGQQDHKCPSGHPDEARKGDMVVEALSHNHMSGETNARSSQPTNVGTAANSVPVGSKRRESQTEEGRRAPNSALDDQTNESPKPHSSSHLAIVRDGSPVEPQEKSEHTAKSSNSVNIPSSTRSASPPAARPQKKDRVASITSSALLTDTAEQGRDIGIPHEILPGSSRSTAATHYEQNVLDVYCNATFRISFKEDATPTTFKVRLQMTDKPSFRKLAGSHPLLDVKAAVMPSDFDSLLINDEKLRMAEIVTGGVVFEKMHSTVAEKIALTCKTRVIALIAEIDDLPSNMLICPTSSDLWKFLGSYWPSARMGGDTSLRFCLFPRISGLCETRVPLQMIPLMPPLSEQESVDAIYAQLLGLDQTMLIDAKESIRAVFVMIPSEFALELHYCSRYFRDVLGLKVYTSTTAGAWDYVYRAYNKYGMLVILHPSVHIWRIPRLQKLLMGSNFRFFQLGVDRNTALLSGHEPLTKYICTRLFYPHCAVTLITDDVLTHFPEKATALIQKFLADTKSKGHTSQLNKIATRPGVKKFLQELAHRKTTEQSCQPAVSSSSVDDRYIALYHAMCELCPPEAEDPFSLSLHPPPLPSSYLVSLREEEMSVYPSLWASDPDAATEYLVQWFASWTLEHASQYRRFCICYQPRVPRTLATTTDADGRVRPKVDPDERRWAERYTHLAVAPPDKLLEASGGA